MAAATEIEELMTGPLVTWLSSCLENADRLAEYEDLTDGILIHEILLQIDPEPVHHGVTPSMGNTSIRIRNMDIIIKNIKALYEEELCQVLLVVPDCVKLGREPDSEVGVENMQLLLLLLLGCAVQCPNKETFIDRIKQLDVSVQHAIVDCIRQVTDSHNIVLTQDAITDAFPTDLMVLHIRRLVRERDEYLKHWTASVIEERSVGSEECSEQQRKASTPMSEGESHHLAVELADWKARLRKQRQELEEKSEALVECREDLENNKILVAKLRQEVQELMQDARAAKAYRDELDAVRERAERVDKLELEIQRYREKLSDIEFYKTRVEELREDNRVLLETREMLEEQLQRARKRADHVLELESEIIKYKQQLTDFTLEREANHEKLQELFEENAQLQLLTKSALNDNSTFDIESDNAEDFDGGSGDNSLSEQLSSNAQARALKLELENHRLLSTIDNLKESSFHESSNKILELEKDKKKLTLKVDQLQGNCRRLNEQNSELEQLFKDALTENRKLQDSIDALKLNSDKQHQELQAGRSQIEELGNVVESMTKEKQRLQCLVESIQRRADELERTNEVAIQQAETWKSEAQHVPELQTQFSTSQAKVESLEKENQSLQRELVKLRESLEVKDVALDQCASETASQEKERSRLTKELEEATTQIARLHEVERESQELVSRAAVDRETLATLQNDLVTQKLNTQQLKSSLEKLGLDLDQLLDPDVALEKIVSSPEVLRFVKELNAKQEETELCRQCKLAQQASAEEQPINEEPSPDLQSLKSDNESLNHQCEEMRLELAILQSSSDSFHSDNAKLQVTVATLQSQISSLSTQHTALQLANSQLVAEKEELVKEHSLQQSAHQQLLLDQVTLQSLHEQLTVEYENLLREREGLKATQRDLRNEIRVLKELCTRQEASQTLLEQEKEKLKSESRSLGNLRAEHSSLKEDFRNLFTASEKLKQEYRSLQEEYRSLRSENGSLKLRQTEMRGELAKSNDQSTLLEIEVSKLNNRCEMLLQMNTGLEDDRRSLMDHVSLILSQYHELLTHNLEDKEHYHMEEKMFTDRLNNLCRQKEKLEEKIMEHYRKLDSCSTKKKSFGATLVKRVRKAGSDFINKVPRNRRSWHEDSRHAENQVAVPHGSESGEGGNESDASLDDLRSQFLPESHTSDGFTQSTLSLGSAGTRRTVYYTGEENSGTRERAQESYCKDQDVTIDNSTAPEVPCPSTPQDSRSLLVYNRISTVIGGVDESSQVTPQGPPSPSQGSLAQTPNTAEEKRSTKTKGKGENSIWYEYGCV
ncbi:girdin isoform X2 [Zootermopsis nevadensis]|uniref:Protein Daple n=1 Tax=Zootermopsis nevadensis TaxID=136037 RepID=A0A067RED8_ZOONE|nr:girdin isoform X2 [Zootermopsis nevadensis]KDR17251.1 Protein Daple [Zootermopsis nevadensis]